MYIYIYICIWCLGSMWYFLGEEDVDGGDGIDSSSVSHSF